MRTKKLLSRKPCTKRDKNGLQTISLRHNPRESISIILTSNILSPRKPRLSPPKSMDHSLINYILTPLILNWYNFLLSHLCYGSSVFTLEQSETVSFTNPVYTVPIPLYFSFKETCASWICNNSLRFQMFKLCQNAIFIRPALHIQSS